MMDEKNIINESASCVLHPDYKSEILNIIRSNLSPKVMKEKILDYHENDIAMAFELLKKEERNKIYTLFSADILAGIFEYCESRNEFISELPLKKRSSILSSLDISVAVEYLRELQKEERKVIIDFLEEDLKKEIKLFNSFDEDEIGSKMTTNYVSIKEGLTVRQAMSELIAQAAENDNISKIYVTDNDDIFVGAIDLKDLIIARQNTELSDIMVTSYPYVYANELTDECIERIKEYSEDSIPVLDSDNKLKGVLTSQDLTHLIDEEFGDDYAKLAGLSAEEELYEPLKKSIGKRLPWLIILLGLGLIVSTVVGAFETVVAHLAIIVSFQSLILAMAGNVGTQSLAVTIRVLMDENLNTKQKLYHIGKEARIGVTNGIILGIVSFVLIGLYLVMFKSQPTAFAFSVSACTGMALILAIFLSSISGTVIPMVSKRLNIDPAVASGPLITTINDLIAVISYYGFAWVFLIKFLSF